jgi:hypothetical protein
METLFKTIEKRYRFTLPEDYRDAWLHGWMDGPWELVVPEMRWLTLEEIAEYAFQDYQLPGFVPFAENGASTVWCWQVDSSGPDGPLVVECSRDCDAALVYAPDFRTAIYRRLLDQACICSCTAEEVEEQVAEIRGCAARLSTVLLPGERAFLGSILARPVESEVMPAGRSMRWHYIVHPKSEIRELIRSLFPEERLMWMQAV